MLYVIYGASGTGKTTLLNCVASKYGHKAIHRKGTTRGKRQYDDFEIESFPNGLPKNRFSPPNGYIYSTYGYEYGIEKKQIDYALENHIPHFVICNDIETIKQLRQDYKDKVRVIYFQFDAPRERILEIQRKRNITDDEIELRMSKMDYLEEQFVKNTCLFDTSLLNRYGDNPEITLSYDVETLVNRYESTQLRVIPDKEIIFETIDYLVSVTKEIEQRKNSTEISLPVQKGFIFIVMPMIQDQGKEIRDKNNLTYLTIKDVASQCGYRAEKVDHILGNSSIEAKIHESIKKAEIVIADLSFERPNCYYELGYARALGKDIIIVSRTGTKIHFDVEHYERIEFEEGEELSLSLGRALMRRKRQDI